MADIRVLSWNVRWQGFAARGDSILEAIRDDAPDIVTLQEVPVAAVDSIVAALMAEASRTTSGPTTTRAARGRCPSTVS